MAISNEMLATTLQIIRDQEVQALYKASPLLDRYKSLKSIKIEDGGSFIRVPVEVSEHSSLTALVDGLEVLDTHVRDTLSYADFAWADLGAPVIISRKERTENSGDKAIVKLAEAKLRSVMAKARRDIHRHLLVGDVAACAKAGLNTLYGHSTVKSNGFIEGAAVGSQSNTIGGLAKSASIPGWDNQFYDCGDDFSANGLVGLSDLWTRCTERNARGREPNLVVMSVDGFRNYKSSIQANERYVDQSALDAGNLKLMYNSAPVVATSDMPTNATDNREFTAYMLDLLSLPLCFMQGCEFDLSDWAALPVSQAGEGAQLYVKLQLTCEGTAANGVLVDGNTV